MILKKKHFHLDVKRGEIYFLPSIYRSSLILTVELEKQKYLATRLLKSYSLMVLIVQ